MGGAGIFAAGQARFYVGANLSLAPPSLCLQQQYAVVKPAVIQGAFFGGLDWLIW